MRRVPVPIDNRQPPIDNLRVRFIIELDGPVFDVAPVYYDAHQAVATEVGWSRLERATFWRLWRSKGKEADFLPGAKPVKIAEYQRRFEQLLETDDYSRKYLPQEGIADGLTKLSRHGPCHAVTLGPNVGGRKAVLDRAGLGGKFAGVELLSADPRRRPAELKSLAESDPRALVVACGDALIRAASGAELLTVGLTCGPCAAARLHQAGAGVVYAQLNELLDSLCRGAPDLVRAGLLPFL
jgi:phosphoglycolate phosphatase-like HAD superfamily hydrolase